MTLTMFELLRELHRLNNTTHDIDAVVSICGKHDDPTPLEIIEVRMEDSKVVIVANGDC